MFVEASSVFAERLLWLLGREEVTAARGSQEDSDSVMTARVLAGSDGSWDQAASSHPDHRPLADSHTGQAHPASGPCISCSIYPECCSCCSVHMGLLPAPTFKSLLQGHHLGWLFLIIPWKITTSSPISSSWVHAWGLSPESLCSSVTDFVVLFQAKSEFFKCRDLYMSCSQSTPPRAPPHPRPG